MNRIPLIKPFIPADAIQRIADVVNSGQLTEGAVTREFERVFREYVGSKHSLAVCNCTVGLELALRAIGVGPGDEVIVPDYTYPASASAVTMLGATAVLVDVDPDTMLLSEKACVAGLTPHTKAVMPVSIFGNPLDYGWLHSLQHQHGFRIIEDAACSIGAAFKGRKVGTWADISVFSMHPRKFITTGEGGMITTDNAEWAAWMDSYKHFGMATQTAAREGIVFERFGTNYKLSNILSALGLSQMAHVGALLGRRQELANRYHRLLGGTPGIRIPRTPDAGEHSFQTCCVFIQNRNDVLARLRADGIEVQIGTYALHRHPVYQPGPLVRHVGGFTGSDRAADEALALPLFHEMTTAQQDRVVAALKAAVSEPRPLAPKLAIPHDARTQSRTPQRKVAPWFWEFLDIAPPKEGATLTFGGQQFVMRDGILRSQALVSAAQAQTEETFGFKWKKRETFESPASLSRMRTWLVERYGDPHQADWLKDHGECPVLLDAGCGACMSGLELFAPLVPSLRYVGIDVSAAVDVALDRFTERGLSAGFMQADISKLPLKSGTVDLIFSEGVLHHTNSTRGALVSLAKLLKKGGRFLFYVYRKKGPVREFTDDFVRAQLQNMSPQDAWKAMETLTQLGIALGELNAEIDIPKPIDLMGIPAGKINVQRLFYWHVAKAFYRPDLTFDEMNHINYDWYAPANAHRQSVEEVRQWCAECGLNIEREVVEEAGITVIARQMN